MASNTGGGRSSPCCSREDDLKLLIIDSNGKKDNGEMNWREKKQE